MLVDATAADHFAMTLLTYRGEDLAPHDSLAPSNTRRLGIGKGTLTAVIAEVEARGAQRAAACGKEAGEVKPRLDRAKNAFGEANQLSEWTNDHGRCLFAHRPPNVQEVTGVKC